MHLVITRLSPVQQGWMVHPGPSASIAGNKLSVRTTAEELNRRKATVYIHPIFAPCRLNIQPDARTNLLEFPFDSTRNIVSLLNSRTLSRHVERVLDYSYTGTELLSRGAAWKAVAQRQYSL